MGQTGFGNGGGGKLLQRFIAWIREVIYRMVHLGDAKRALQTDIAISSEMQTAIDLWDRMFLDKAPWLDDTTKSMGLPAAIAAEIARLVTVEMESKIEGSARADYLQEEYQIVLGHLRTNTEIAAACGGVVFKPYVDGTHIAVDCVPVGRFLPTAFNSRGEMTGAVFVEQVQKGKAYYTRMERHQMTENGYMIRNLAFMSSSEATLGAPCSLAVVDEWAQLEPEIKILYKDGTAPERPLFAYLRMPFANNIDPGSPLGVSTYARAVGVIEEADKQYSRILWEYEGSELAVMVTDGALEPGRDATRPRNVPIRRKRLFQELALDSRDGSDLFEVFSPQIRDASLFNGLDKLLKRIEFNCCLSYGTLSDPQSVEKTAEEIKMSKQRSYTAVCDIQHALQGTLEHLIWIMDFYASMYNLAPKGDYECSFTWGDGILENTELEFARRKQLADSNMLKPEKLLAWYFGISEEEAKEYIPEKSEPTFPTMFGV